MQTSSPTHASHYSTRLLIGSFPWKRRSYTRSGGTHNTHRRRKTDVALLQALRPSECSAVQQIPTSPPFIWRVITSKKKLSVFPTFQEKGETKSSNTEEHKVVLFLNAKSQHRK